MVYNRQEVGARLRCRRQEMGITREEAGRLIGKDGRYYRDIENGRCGMSVETLILLSAVMELSLDYLVYGISEGGDDGRLEEQKVVTRLLSLCNSSVREGAVKLLKVYLENASD